jgi:hypothetical protein
MKTNTALIFLLLVLFSCEKDACPSNWTLYESEALEICYPDSWELNDSGIYGSELVIIDMLDAESSGFGKNVNIIKQHQSYFPQIQSLDDYATFSKNQMADYLEDVQILFFGKKKISNFDAYRTVMQANQSGRELFFVQFYFAFDDHYYVATFTTTSDDSPENKKLGEEIMESMIWK